MQSIMSRFFDDPWQTVWPVVDTSSTLPLDVYEADNSYTVIATLPAVEPDSIHITLHQNVLTLSVDIPQYTPQAGQHLLLVERVSGQLTRSITLPRPVHNEQTEAVYENGVLTLTLPISPDARPKRIAVNTNGHLLQSKN